MLEEQIRMHENFGKRRSPAETRMVGTGSGRDRGFSLFPQSRKEAKEEIFRRDAEGQRKQRI